MSQISPINTTQQQQVITTTQHYLAIAEQHFAQAFPALPVHFDLKGRMAGMYKIEHGKRMIRYNPWLFAKYFEENLASTVPHEVAHYVSDLLYGLKRIRPHGREWKQIMQLFNADDSRTHQFDLDGIPQKQSRRYTYVCACREHEVSTLRHNRICSGLYRYHCKHCHGPLKIVQP